MYLFANSINSAVSVMELINCAIVNEVGCLQVHGCYATIISECVLSFTSTTVLHPIVIDE